MLSKNLGHGYFTKLCNPFLLAKDTMKKLAGL